MRKNEIKRKYRLHQIQNPHKQQNALKDIILGGQDGLVNVLGIVMGITAVTTDEKILIATVLAAASAESISMAAVAYTSNLSQYDYYKSEYKRERDEIKKDPEMEEEEVRRIFQKKGFRGALLNKVVDTITTNKTEWIKTMMNEELHLEPINKRDIFKSALIVGISTIIGSLIPVFPFFFLSVQHGLAVSIIASGIALFGVGIYQAKTMIGNWKQRGAQMVIIGLGAALVGYIVAKIFHA